MNFLGLSVLSYTMPWHDSAGTCTKTDALLNELTAQHYKFHLEIMLSVLVVKANHYTKMDEIVRNVDIMHRTTLFVMEGALSHMTGAKVYDLGLR